MSAPYSPGRGKYSQYMDHLGLLPRTPYRRTSENTSSARLVNKGRKKSWSPLQAPPGGSPSQASEFLLQERVVFGAGLLAFQPLHVVLNPRVGAFFRIAREGVRRNEVHQPVLGAFPEHTYLPILSLLLVMFTVCQLPKLLAGLGAGDGLKRALEGLPGSVDQNLRLAPQDFLSHLVYRLFGSHGLLLP